MKETAIRSIIENDLYKFSMSYYYQRTTPEGIGTFHFKDRNNLVFTQEYADALKQELKNLESLALTEDEFSWCLTNISYIPRCFRVAARIQI